MKVAYAQELKDIVGPVGYPEESSLSMIILFSLIVVALAIFTWVKLRKRLFQKEIFLPYWEQALKDLEELKGADYLSTGDYKQYWTKISHVLRLYIEERFDIKAVEMTTEEFLNHLKGSTQIVGNDKLILNEFLNASDLVKFAKHTPDVKEAQKGSGYVYEFIQSTKPKEND